ncbi:MAG: hypothetical protein HQK79_22980 [Desulfobacterales bacterium]|nr:hypothetical protein [Desulfobacterales bacterium]
MIDNDGSNNDDSTEKNYVIAFSGSHGVGKTTAVFKKAYELKMQYKTKRIGIADEATYGCPYPINKGMSVFSQLWMFTKHINKELTLLSQYDIVIADRTVVDIIAYTKWAGLSELSEEMIAIIHHHIKIYKKIHFKRIENNDFFINDNHRDSEDFIYRKEIEDILLNLYDRFGLLKDDNIMTFE